MTSVLRLALGRAGLLTILRFLVGSVHCGQRSVSRIEGRGGLLSLTGEASEPGRVVSVELVVEEDAEVISDMNHTVLGRPERLNGARR